MAIDPEITIVSDKEIEFEKLVQKAISTLNILWYLYRIGSEFWLDRIYHRYHIQCIEITGRFKAKGFLSAFWNALFGSPESNIIARIDTGVFYQMISKLPNATKNNLIVDIFRERTEKEMIDLAKELAKEFDIETVIINRRGY